MCEGWGLHILWMWKICFYGWTTYFFSFVGRFLFLLGRVGGHKQLTRQLRAPKSCDLLNLLYSDSLSELGELRILPVVPS
jgi:hypothetical protein